MKRPDIETIKARLNAATRGPWKSCQASECFENWPVCPSLGTDDDGANWAVSTDGIHASEMDRGDAKTDAEFIAHARQDIPDLLAYIAELEDRLAPTIKPGLTVGPTCKPSLQVDYTSETEDLTTWPQTRGAEWRQMGQLERLQKGDVRQTRSGLSYTYSRNTIGCLVGLMYSKEAWTRRPAPEAQP